MRQRIVKKNVNVRIYDTLTALYGNSKIVHRKYKLILLKAELKTLNNV